MITRRDFTKYLSAAPLFGLSLNSKDVLESHKDDGPFYMVYSGLKTEDARAVSNIFHDVLQPINILGPSECNKLDSLCLRPRNKESFIRVHWFIDVDTDFKTIEQTKEAYKFVYETKISKIFGEFKKYAEDVKIHIWSPGCIRKTLNILKGL